MTKLLKIEPDSKDGLIKNLSEALELARKGQIDSLSIIYERKDGDGIRNYYHGIKASVNMLLDIAKHDMFDEFPTISHHQYGDDSE